MSERMAMRLTGVVESGFLQWRCEELLMNGCWSGIRPQSSLQEAAGPGSGAGRKALSFREVSRPIEPEGQGHVCLLSRILFTRSGISQTFLYSGATSEAFV